LSDPIFIDVGDVSQVSAARIIMQKLASTLDGGPSVVRLAGDVEVRLRVEDQLEAAADERLVVGEEDRGHAVLSSGSSARTANPPLSLGPAENVPPKIPTRSRMPISPCPPAESTPGRPSSVTSTARSDSP